MKGNERAIADLSLLPFALSLSKGERQDGSLTKATLSAWGNFCGS